MDMVRPGGLLYGDTIPDHTEYKNHGIQKPVLPA